MIPSFWNHIPLLSILLPAAAGVVCALLRRERAARRLTLAALALTAALSALFTACLALAGAELTALPSPGAANSAPAPPRGRWPAPFPC